MLNSLFSSRHSTPRQQKLYIIKNQRENMNYFLKFKIDTYLYQDY